MAAKIVGQLGDALNSAHRAGIIHRDLKPANIMYDPATQTARLLDFGIARDSDEAAEQRLTRAGFFVGTLQYVAPEALSGELVGEQADVYSLATIAYHLLTGKLPFPGRTPRELFQQLLTQSPVSLNAAIEGLKFPRPSKQWSCAGSKGTSPSGGRRSPSLPRRSSTLPLVEGLQTRRRADSSPGCLAGRVSKGRLPSTLFDP